MSINDKVIEIISTFSLMNKEDISQSDLLSNIGIDSLTSVELIIQLEDQLGITIDDSDLDPSKLTTVESIIQLVQVYIKE